MDFTGTGNTLESHNPMALQPDHGQPALLGAGDACGRLPLRPGLGAGAWCQRTSTARSSFFAAIAQDPVLSRVKLIAEPWDLGEGGYRVGGFPTGWAEWNGRYRDDVRAFWKRRRRA
ncbi:MAG: hypothetical protein QM742_16595 [Aquabacterium sp.]